MALSQLNTLRDSFLSNYTHTTSPVFCQNMQNDGNEKIDFVTFGDDVCIGQITGFGFSTSNGKYNNSTQLCTLVEVYNAIDEMIKDLYNRISSLQ